MVLLRVITSDEEASSSDEEVSSNDELVDINQQSHNYSQLIYRVPMHSRGNPLQQQNGHQMMSRGVWIASKSRAQSPVWSELRPHMEPPEPQGIYQCPLCRIFFWEPNQIYNHYCIHTSNRF